MHGRIPLAPELAAPQAEDDAIDLRQLVDFFWRRWKLILATALAVVLLTALGLLAVTPRYTATAQVLLEPRKENIFGAESILPELNLDTGTVDSQISVIQSINLLRRVVEKEKLTEDPEFGGPEKASLLGLLKEYLGLGKAEDPGDTALAGLPPPVLSAIENLREALDVTRVARQYVLSIGVTSEDPDKAVRLANAVADAFVVDRLDARYEAAKRASAWLTERMETLREQVRQSEEAVARFRAENNLTTSSEGKVAISEQQLAELNAKLVTARAETAERKAKYEQAQQVQAKGGNLQAIPDVVRSVVISDLRKQEAEVTRKEADLIARYSDQHPTVVNARAERRDIERNISAEVARIIANLKNDYDVAVAREMSLQASLDQLSGAGDNTSVGIRLRELERINVANKTLFENFLSRAKITQEQTAFEEREARVISPAVKPKHPSFPKKIIFLPLALIVGLGLGVSGAVALDLLASGFNTPKEIEAKLGRPVLAAVPLLSDGERRIDGQVLDPVGYLMKKPLSRYAEAVRSIRVGVQMSDVDSPPKVVLVTSSIPKEGKSTLSACLAFSAAKGGQRVILIDGDLRHPSTSKYFGVDARPGLVDILTGTVAPEMSIVAAGPIAILPAGSSTQNPADLLGSARMRQIVARLKEIYDYVVIDSPPVAPVVDAKVLSTMADKIIYVVKWQTTSREVVSECIEQVSTGRNIAGIALSIMNERKAPRYGPYSYYSGDQYAGYYQQ